MGSRISQSSGPEQSQRNTSFAINLYQSFRESIQRRRIQRSRPRYGSGGPVKRNSVLRPVLRLQVKSETIEKHKKSGSNGLHLISKEKLETLARESGMYENIFPKNPVPFTRNHAHNQHRYSTASRSSMVIVQFVDDGPLNLADGGRHDNGYDRLLPRGDFDHLCTLKYGRVNTTDEQSQSEEGEGHLSTVDYGRRNSQPATLKLEQLKDRIIEHLEPYEPDPLFQRSNSMGALSSLRVTDSNGDPRMRRHQSTGFLLDGEVGEWSLGESIMRTLSRGNVHLFDIDNPTSESEKEVHRTWPELKHKLAKFHQSQEALNMLDDSSDSAAFLDSDPRSFASSDSHYNPTKMHLPVSSNEGYLL